jgi:hypothetical protein
VIQPKHVRLGVGSILIGTLLLVPAIGVVLIDAVVGPPPPVEARFET